MKEGTSRERPQGVLCTSQVNQPTHSANGDLYIEDALPAALRWLTEDALSSPSCSGRGGWARGRWVTCP